jgi:hypothetical protein
LENVDDASDASNIGHATGLQAPAVNNVVYGTYSGLALLMDVHHPTKANGHGLIVIQGSG